MYFSMALVIPVKYRMHAAMYVCENLPPILQFSSFSTVIRILNIIPARVIKVSLVSDAKISQEISLAI